MKRVAIVAGEASGDYLGAGLIEALRNKIPDVEFEGVAGPRMSRAGCQPLFPSDKLAVVGLVEVFRRLRELLGLRRWLFEHFRRCPPDLFIGIDVPEFNLPLERRLKAEGIPTVHYVGPQVWAWRPGRVRRIRQSVDLLLTLFPFETEFYKEHAVPVRFVGHPLADEIPEHADRNKARETVGMGADQGVVALLPGSRVSELRHLAKPFVEAAAWLRRQVPDIRFVAPMADARTRSLFERAIAQYGADVPITVLDGSSREAIAAADVVLAASGTATLETVLMKRPVVVAYRLSPVTYWLAKRMVKSRYYSLPNLLAGREIAPELIQHDVNGRNLGEAVKHFLDNPDASAERTSVFEEIYRSLRRDASESAATAVAELLNQEGAAQATKRAGIDGRGSTDA